MASSMRWREAPRRSSRTGTRALVTYPARVPSFRIDARDGSARAGVLSLAHGEVRTPAFVPLADVVQAGHDVTVTAGQGVGEVVGHGHVLVLPAEDAGVEALGGLGVGGAEV